MGILFLSLHSLYIAESCRSFVYGRFVRTRRQDLSNLLGLGISQLPQTKVAPEEIVLLTKISKCWYQERRNAYKGSGRHEGGQKPDDITEASFPELSLVATSKNLADDRLGILFSWHADLLRVLRTPLIL